MMVSLCQIFVVRIQVLSSGSWSNPSSNLLPQPRGFGAVTPGPLTMDETVSLLVKRHTTNTTGGWLKGVEK